ncbi:uncharacterized protein [Diadema setosum]|uniref:uncharacterized protein n=1 Tax=Diadema setosum TaxID=31175 RepID=UPI003B3AFF68
MDQYVACQTWTVGKMWCFGILIVAVSGNVLGISESMQTRSRIDKDDSTMQDSNFLDQYMEEYLDKNHYTGATLGVLKGSSLVYAAGYGTTLTGAAMEPTSLLPVSSLSKTITSVAILKLVQEGHLHLTDKVFGPEGLLSSYAPFPSSESADYRLRKITVEQLLHHTAGWSQQKPPVYDPLMNEVYLSRGHNVLNISREMGLTAKPTPKDIIKFMMGRRLDHAPGTTYEYSNFGYCILGQIIAEVSWMSYEEFVKENILEPLGMWQTELKQLEPGPLEGGYSLSFHDGDIPLMQHIQTAAPSLDLIGPALGWHSTVYDIMRFVSGIHDKKFLSEATLQLLQVPPSSPMFEHQETWPGLGVRVANTGAWWQVADPHDNEIVLYHHPVVGRPQATTPYKQEDSLGWVLIMSSNNRKNLRTTFDEVFSTINWPSRNMFLDDCGLSQQDVANDASAVLMNAQIPEDRFSAYVNALSRGSFYPKWINTYDYLSETFVSIISTHQANSRHPEIQFGLLSSELRVKVAAYDNQGMQLSFVHSFSSHRRHGHILQAAIFTSSHRTLSSGIHKSLEHYLHVAQKHQEQGYTPIVQSVTSRHGKKAVSFVFEKLATTNWNSYTNLTVHQLDGVVRSNALQDRTLHYLQCYFHEGELLFSAIFIDEGLHTWHFQATLSESDFLNAAETYRRLGYHPRITTGYEMNYELNYAVLWVKQ